MLLVSIMLLAILTFGAASAADDTVVNNLTTVDDGGTVDIDSPVDEIEVGGEIDLDDSSSDNAIDEDVKDVKDKNPKLGSSNDDVLGDDYDMIYTPEYIDMDAPHIPTGNIKFVGEFRGTDDYSYLIFDPGCVIDASEATFIDLGVILTDDVQINGLTLTSTKYLEDGEMGMASGALLYITGSNNIIDNLNLTYAPEEGYDVYGVLIEDAADFQITNSVITFTGSNLYEYYEYAMKIVGASGSNLLKGNTITANLPILDVDFSKGDPGLVTDLVLNTGIKESEGIDMIGNTFIANVIDRNGGYPTLDCIMIESSNNLNIINNTLIETDDVTQRGETNYLNVLDMYYSSDVLVKGNTIHVESDGGSEDAGTSYCIQLTGPYENVVIDGNDLYSHCEGPALGVYSQNYYGDTEILVQNNKIDVTGLPTYNSWGLVSGIELQDNVARVYNNDIKTRSITGYCEEGMNLYGISYAQALNENHNYDIQGNTIETEGPYTVYLLKAQDTVVTDNYLISSVGEGDETVYIDNAQGSTTIENNNGRKNFYVDPNGDDNNPGSEDEPLQSIGHALELIPEGGKIYLLEGTHALQERIEVSKSFSIIGKNRKTTLIDCNGYEVRAAGVPFEKISFENIGFINLPTENFINIDGCEFDQLNIENCLFDLENPTNVMIIAYGMGNFNFIKNTIQLDSDYEDMALIVVAGDVQGTVQNNILNSVSAIVCESSSLVNANMNYWGTNEPLDINKNGLNIQNIVVAQSSIDSDEVMAGDEVTVTVDFNNLLDISSGEITKQSGLIQDDITVRFKANGEFTNNDVAIENGVATTTYTNDVAGTDEIVSIVPNQELINEISIIQLGELEINVTDTWVNYSNDVVAALPVETGSAAIKVNGKTVATVSFSKGKLTYTIKASDMQIGENTVEITGDSFNGQKTFNVLDYDGVVTNQTFFNYFNASNSYRLCEHVPEGAVLDFQGSFISDDDVSYVMEINKPVNIISTTKDVYIDLNTVAQGMQGENPGNRFTVSLNGSGSNISDISFHNSQLWFFNAHNLNINNMTSIVEDQQIGSGVGVVAFRGGSSHINVKNSYFSTKNNGGSSTFVLTNASYISIDNSSIIGIGNVGNLIYMNFYNMDLPDGMFLPQVIQLVNQGKLEINDHNNFTNCYIQGPDTVTGICILVQNMGSGHDVFVNNTFVYGGSTLNSGAYSIVRNNTFIGGCSITAGKDSVVEDNKVGAGVSIASNTVCNGNIINGTLTVKGKDNTITDNFINSTGNYAVDLGSTTGNTVDGNFLYSKDKFGNDAITGTGSNNIGVNRPLYDIQVTVSEDNIWLGSDNTVEVYINGANGKVAIKVNDNLIAEPSLTNNRVTQTISAADIKAGANKVEVIYDGESGSATFNVYGLVTNETWDTYFDGDNEGVLRDFVPEGATLDFQGKFLTSDDKSYKMTINKPVNIITSTGDAYIDLNTVAGSLMGEDPGSSFIINNAGSGTNVSGLYFHNSQIWLTNTHNVTLDGISAVVENQRVGSGVGATAIRNNSTYVTVKNSYFYTKNNGGSTSVALSWADYCTIENNTILVEGEVGNMIYLNTYNVDIPDGVSYNAHNLIRNNVIWGNTTASPIRWGIVINGADNIIDNNTIHYNNGVGLAAALNGENIANNVFSNNKLYDTCSIGGMTPIANAEFYNNYISGNVNVGANCELHNNTVDGTFTLAAGGEAYDNTIGGTLTANDAYVHNNTATKTVLNGANAKISGDVTDLDVKSNVNMNDTVITGTLRFIGSNSVVSNVTANNVVFGPDRNNKAENNMLANSTVTGTITLTARYSIENSLIGNDISSTVIEQGSGDIIYQNNIITTGNYAIDASNTRAAECNISDNYLVSNGKKGNDAVNYLSGKDHVVENNGPDMSLEDIADVLIGNDNTVTVNILPTYRNTPVTIKVNDKLINETSAGGVFNQVIKASDIKAGENTVEVTAYDKTLTKTFNAYEIIIDVENEIKLGKDTEANITIAGATGDIIVKLNGNEIATQTLQDGSVTQTIAADDIVEGENTIEVIYGEFSNSTTFNAVKKVEEIIIVVQYENMWLNEPNSVTVTIPEATGNVSIKVNGREIATPELSEGSVTQTIEISDMINGENTVEVTYDGFTNSTTFNAQDNVVTPENFEKFFDEDGFIQSDVPFDELIFKGEFDAPADYLIIEQPISIIGDNAVLNNMGVVIASDEVKLDKLNFTADSSLGSLIMVQGSDVDLTNLDIVYSAGSEEAIAIDIMDCSDVRLLNSTVFFESHVPDDSVKAVAVQAVNTQNVLIDGNNITTKLPCVYVDHYDEDYYMMGSNNVNPVRLKDCSNLIFTNNNINSTTNDCTASFPTIQSIYIIGCSDSVIDHNNISMIDKMTPSGMDNYMYGINFGHNNNVTFSYNNFEMFTSGGKDAAGTNYAFQGVESDVIIRGNNITSKSYGPNLGIYVASMFGEDSNLLIEDNFINVTGYASPSGNWALVSGIEI